MGFNKIKELPNLPVYILTKDKWKYSFKNRPNWLR